jgi:hypothetical protein
VVERYVRACLILLVCATLAGCTNPRRALRHVTPTAMQDMTASQSRDPDPTRVPWADATAPRRPEGGAAAASPPGPLSPRAQRAIAILVAVFLGGWLPALEWTFD